MTQEFVTHTHVHKMVPVDPLDLDQGYVSGGFSGPVHKITVPAGEHWSVQSVMFLSANDQHRIRAVVGLGGVSPAKSIYTTVYSGSLMKHVGCGRDFTHPIVANAGDTIEHQIISSSTANDGIDDIVFQMVVDVQTVP